MSALEVILRLRPTKSEAVGLYKKDSRTVILKSKSGNQEEYKFERVYDTDDSQQTIYGENVCHLVTKVLDGVNVSVLAYGPTGTGKTYTIEGESVSGKEGIIPRAALELCKKVRHLSDDSLLTISCMEVYNEKIIDLLNNDPKPDLKLFEDAQGLIEVEGLTKLTLNSFDDFRNLFLLAKERRTVGATSLNEKSSRSHAIWRFRVNRKIGTGSDAIDREAKIDLVDLAGSEDNRKTLSTDQRFIESTKINLSLTVLKRVIKSVAAKEKNIPTRESKLTRLLRDAFGGNAHTLLILNVGPEEENLRDSSASLDFSTVAKQVLNSPFEGLSMTTPKKTSRMPLELNRTPTSPFAGRMREFNDSIERHKNKILVMKKENRQKAISLKSNLIKELKATEKENNEKIARGSQEKIPSEPAPKIVKSSAKYQNVIDYLNVGENLTRLEGVGPKTAQKIRDSRPIKDFGHFVKIFGETRATKAAACFVPE